MVSKVQTINRRLFTRRCLACGYDGALLQDGQAPRCARCGCDLRRRPARSYAEMEGLVGKPLTLDAPRSALVYPATETLRFPPDFGGSRAGAEGAGGGAGRSSDVRGLREYAPGDALRRIHWRSSLRVGELMVREVENEHEAEVEVRLRTLGEQPGEAFERSVGWSASEVASLLEMGARVALRTDRDYLPAGAGPRHRARLLGHLALVQPTPLAEAP